MTAYEMRISGWSSDLCSSDLGLSGTVGTVLGPIFSLRRRVRIAPGATVVLQLWTVAAGTREEALALADRFRDAGAFASASESALQRSQETLAGLGIDAAQAQRLQRLAVALLYSDPTLRGIGRAPGRESVGSYV